MISRIVDCNVKTDKLANFRQTLHNEFIPRIRQEHGLVDIVESIDTKTGHFMCMTLWKNADDVKRYDTGLFQEVATGLTPFLEQPPTVHTMEVETSTVHNIAAGRGAAA
jgi:quinol monooxygenase YgiN